MVCRNKSVEDLYGDISNRWVVTDEYVELQARKDAARTRTAKRKQPRKGRI